MELPLLIHCTGFCRCSFIPLLFYNAHHLLVILPRHPQDLYRELSFFGFLWWGSCAQTKYPLVYSPYPKSTIVNMDGIPIDARNHLVWADLLLLE